jgi:hypothetical protein
VSAVSVPTAELSGPGPSAPTGTAAARWRDWTGGGRLLILLGGVAVAIALVSLTVPSTPSYDPWSWLVWGKEIVHGSLHTQGGPSWKPLPMLFTVPFALFGHFQPDMWLVVSRAGAAFCALMCFKLAWRLSREIGPERGERAGAARTAAQIAPVLAGVLAAGSLLNSPGFLSDNALGYSEGLATGLLLCAVDRFLDGARRQAFVLGFVVALDRPETWPFWGLYGIWLAWRDPEERKLVIGLFVLTLLLWFGPAGLSGVERAQRPRGNSAAFTSCPFCTVFRREAWVTVLNRLKIPGIVAILVAAAGLWRSRARWRGWAADPAANARAWLVVIGLFGFVWWALIGLETQLHFSGNARYLVIGTASVGVVSGAAWGWLAQAIAASLARLGRSVRQLGRPAVGLPAGVAVTTALFLAVPPWIGDNLIDLQKTHRALVYQASLRESLNRIVRDYGGVGKLLACGRVMTEGFQVPMLAWTLGVRTLQIEDQPPTNPQGWAAIQTGPHSWRPLPASAAPNVILQDRDNGSLRTALLPLASTIQHWEALGVRYRPSGGLRVGPFRLFTACRK